MSVSKESTWTEMCVCVDLYAGKALQRMVLYIEKADTAWAEMWTRWEAQAHSEFFLIGK